MYKKNATLKLILFFVVVTVAGQTALYAGEIPGGVKFKASDLRSYSAQGRMAITKERRERQMKLKRDITQAEQENMQAEQQIKAEQVRIKELEAQLAEEKLATKEKSSPETSAIQKPEIANEQGFLTGVKKGFGSTMELILPMNQLAQAKNRIASLKQRIIDNKGKILAAAALLGVGYLTYRRLRGPKTEENFFRGVSNEDSQMLERQHKASEEQHLSVLKKALVKAQQEGNLKDAEGFKNDIARVQADLASN